MGKGFFFSYVNLFWEIARSREGAETERERENPKQVLSCQHRAGLRARSHEPWDHDLSQSQMFNRLSHPGTPRSEGWKKEQKNERTKERKNERTKERKNERDFQSQSWSDRLRHMKKKKKKKRKVEENLRTEEKQKPTHKAVVSNNPQNPSLHPFPSPGSYLVLIGVILSQRHEKVIPICYQNRESGSERLFSPFPAPQMPLTPLQTIHLHISTVTFTWTQNWGNFSVS